MDVLKGRRRVIKGKFTRIQTFLDNVSNSVQTKQAFLVRIEGLEAAWTEFNDIHNDILDLNDDNEVIIQEQEYEEIETKYYTLKTSLTELLAEYSEASATTTAATTTDVKLPRISLPTFSGNYLDWSSFRDLFTSMIHNNSKLSPSQKLHYLKNSLTGDASGILQSIEVTDANYTEAWDLLVERYQNERLLIHSHLKSLFGQPNLSNESAIGLRKMLDTTIKHIRALHALGVDTDTWDYILVFLVSEKLDSNSRHQWELASPGTNYPTFLEIKTFLEQRCRALEASGSKPKPKPSNQPQNNNRNIQHTASYTAQSDHNPVTCPICNGDHFPFKCAEFAKLNDKDKAETAKQYNLCFNCLRKGHSSKYCRSTSNSRKCGARHHTLLHFQPAQTRRETQEDDIPEVPATSVAAHISSSLAVTTEVLLATALVKVEDAFGQLQECRVLLDNGSQASFVTESCVQRLGLQRSRANISVFGIGQTGSGNTRGVVNLKMHSMNSNFSFDVTALILYNLTGIVPRRKINTEQWGYISNIQLADPNFNIPGVVDILLGADIFTDLLLDGRIAGTDTMPSAINSRLGWILSGKINNTTSNTITVNLANFDSEFELRKFWELEETPSMKYLTDDEKQCEGHFASTYSRDSSGRFCVKLPYKQETKLGKSKELVCKRFSNIERRLEQLPEHKAEYHKFMNEYLELDHMELIPANERQEIVGKTNYLPHHFIIKESSTTTKLRVVFDASAKTTSNISLNDTQLIGPRLQDDMWAILLRFRLYKYAFTADIEKMYRQIRVSSSDADLQRIVWRASPSDELQEFRLKTVTYGTASAPYQATKSLQQLALDEGDKFPLAKDVVLRDFYMDDLMSGADKLDDALTLQTDVIALLKRGGFHLRKWSSNSNEVLESVPEGDRETKLQPLLGTDESIKALGLHWQPSGDAFFFVVTLPAEIGQVTKRRALSEIARLFDPLGWLAPVIILAKIIIQKIWISGASWDDPLPSILEDQWNSLRSQLHELDVLRVPRCVNPSNCLSYQLHGFCDTSESAYGAVIYLRCEGSEGGISVNLLCSKTRVAPVKQVCLPRLELCGAVLLTKLLQNVQHALNTPMESCHAWTDSMVTLAWISGHPNRWKTFVANRVADIQNVLPPDRWSHVPTLDNPADAASRGLLPQAILRSEHWWNGPRWLTFTSEHWPKTQTIDHNEEIVCRSEKKVIKTFTALCKTNWNLNQRFSSLTKLKRVTAYCLRFIRNCQVRKDEKSLGPLSTKELDQALKVCVKSVQTQEFERSLASIIGGGVSEPHLQSLNPFIDDTGVLRVGGRLRQAKIEFEKKFPILLPKQHCLTELIVNDTHVKQLHAGPQLTLATIRDKFWIINGRDVVRRILHRCITCHRDRKTAISQQMGDLPSHRVEAIRPFLRCGVDFGGPILIKTVKGRGGKNRKAYIALFVCFSTKAIHLEVVSDLTTESFLAALKRFVARRGKFSDIYSDNGSNFIGAKNELRELQRLLVSELHNTTIEGYLTAEGMNWHFIPARAPHFGGLWEAGIRSVKTHLRRIVGQTALTFEELTTVLVQIEACLNSRPICPLSSDPNDFGVLTPGHFLIGESLSAIPEPSITHLKINRLSRWQRVQQLTQHFWQRWHKEYLSGLQQRPKWPNKQNNIKAGDLVIIKEDKVPPLHWIKGRVLETHPGKDGLVRVVSVKTATGIYTRPVTKMCILPIN